MAVESLNPGHKYTFAYIDNVASIVASSDNITKTYFRDDIQITGSMQIDGSINSVDTLQPLLLENDGDVRIRFNTTEFGPVISQRWVIGVDSQQGAGGPVNTFCINQQSGFATTVDFRVSGSTIVLDYNNMPTSATGLQTGTVYRDAGNYLRIAP